MSGGDLWRPVDGDIATALVAAEVAPVPGLYESPAPASHDPYQGRSDILVWVIRRIEIGLSHQGARSPYVELNSDRGPRVPA